MSPARWRPVLLGLVLGSIWVLPAFAQGTGRSLDIDVSIRSAAMGGASNALFRGGELNHWGNPALLGYVQGIRYERGRTQLVPTLADDVWLTTNVTKLGVGGLGFVFGGWPAGPDGVTLDYGLSTGTDDQGNPTGTFRSFERSESWGVGVNLLQSIETMWRGGSGDWSRFGDVSLGLNFKDVRIALAPDSSFGHGRTRARDYGVLVRLTPMDAVESGDVLPLRIDFSYGRSVLSYNDTHVVFLDEDQASPLTRHRRNGVALQLASGIPGWTPEQIEHPLARSLARGFFPMLAVSLTSDWASLGAGDQVDYKTSGRGVEFSIANVFAIRRGHYEDRIGDIDGPTHGWSVTVPVGRFGGFMHEEAWFPQARHGDLGNVHRKGYAAWIDPLEIVAAIRGPRETSRLAVAR